MERPGHTGQRIRVSLGTRKPSYPPLISRIVHFVFRPESWAEAIRHPLRYTLVPLLVAILLSGAITGIAFACRVYQGARTFATAYDANFPAMEYAGGKLTVVPGDVAPKPIRIPAAGGDLVVDPSGQTKPADLRDSAGMLIGDSFVYQHMMGMEWKTPLKEFPPFTTMPEGTRIDSASLQKAVHDNGVAAATLLGTMVFLVTSLRDVLWAAAMMFLIAPVVVLAGASLRMRHRTAIRAAAAVTVPLVVFSAILSALGISPTNMFQPEYVSAFWFVATVLLGCWAGVLATKILRPRQRRRAM